MTFEKIIRDPRSRIELFKTFLIILGTVFGMGCWIAVWIYSFSYGVIPRLSGLFCITILAVFAILGSFGRLRAKKRYILIDEEKIEFCLHKERKRYCSNFDTDDFFGYISRIFDYMKDDNVFFDSIPIAEIKEINIDKYYVSIEKNKRASIVEFGLFDLTEEEVKRVRLMLETIDKVLIKGSRLVDY